MVVRYHITPPVRPFGEDNVQSYSRDRQYTAKIKLSLITCPVAVLFHVEKIPMNMDDNDGKASGLDEKDLSLWKHPQIFIYVDG